MKARKILILDSNKTTRNLYENIFKNTHFDVESSSSAAYVVAKVIQGYLPLIILGDQYEEKLSPEYVVSILKKVNKNIKIILISDDSSLESLKKIHSEGILYHSLKPTSEEDFQEIFDVVCYSKG